MPDLERTIDERIKPMLDEAMQKFLGIRIQEIKADISDRLKRPLLELHIDTSIPFKRAKKAFKKLYLGKLLQLHFGNVSHVAELSGVDRRSIHRLMAELRIGANKFREELDRRDYLKEEAVKQLIEQTIDSYKSSLNPGKFSTFYKQAPVISREIVKQLPEAPLTLKQAEREFETAYFKQALSENNGDEGVTSRKIGLRYESLHRKMKTLGISK